MDAVVGFLTDWGLSLWGYLALSGVALIAGFGLAGLIAEFVPAGKVAEHLGGDGRGARVWSVVKASAVGVPMPLCSCSVIPTAAALRRRGAGRGASAAFAISTPEIDAPSVGLTWALLGPGVAVVRPVGAFVSAVTAGVLINVFESPPDGGEAEPAPKPCCGSAEPEGEGCCGVDAPVAPGLGSRLTAAARVGYLDMPKDLALWLVVGLAVSGLIGVVAGPGWLGETFGDGAGAGLGSKLAALVVGVPLYVCATSSTPLAAAVIAAGLSPGAAVVFLLAGPATNPATIGWALKDLGLRATAIYLVVIAGVALGAGVATDTVLSAWIVATMPAEIEGSLHEHVGPLQAWAGGALGLLLAVGAFRALRGWVAAWRVSPSAGSCCSTG